MEQWPLLALRVSFLFQSLAIVGSEVVRLPLFPKLIPALCLDIGKEFRMSRSRPNEGAMPVALAVFLTWPTYGTWLPGDKRGWAKYKKGYFPGDESVRVYAESKMVAKPCLLDSQQRLIVEVTVRQHCEIRNWQLFAINCRSNHIHIVIAGKIPAGEIRSQLKAWSSRRLKANQIECEKPADEIRSHWWAERGSTRYLNDQKSLDAAIHYVNEQQDMPNE